MAALSDNLTNWGVYEDDARDIASSIYSVRSRRLDPVFRVSIRDGGHILESILSVTDDAGKELRKKFNLPSEKERENMMDTQVLLMEAYEFFYSRIKEIGPEKAITLYDVLLNQVYFFVNISPNAQFARKFVVGAGKGKNLEPVDEFKALVCFECVRGDDEQDKLMKLWNELSNVVGRDVLQSACLFWAQCVLQKPLKKFGEVDLMAAFLRHYMKQAEMNGFAFFSKQLQPSALLLHQFREGSIHWVTEAALRNKADRRSIPSLSFLREAAQTPTSKEIEIAILGMLFRWDMANTDEEKEAWERNLNRLEQIALWMMLCQPAARIRRQRSIDIARRGQWQDANLLDADPLFLTSDERKLLKEKLDTTTFTRNKAKAAKTILERLNEFELLHGSQGRMLPLRKTLQLEHVLPQKYGQYSAWKTSWEDEDAQEWLHRLGNLALLNKGVNIEISNGPFEMKRNQLSKSPYPLTKMLAEYDQWTASSVRKHHGNLLQMAHKVWDLA